MKKDVYSTGSQKDLTDLEKYRIWSDQIITQVRQGAEEMGYEDASLTEEDARSLLVGVSF